MSDADYIARAHTLLLLVLAAIGVTIPFAVGSYMLQMSSIALINVVVAMGLTILIGQAGQVSLASPSFVAIGAYLVIILMKKAGLSYWLAMPLAGLGAAAFGALLGFPALRTRGFYLAIVSLAFLQITTIVIESFPEYTGGVRGISAPRPTLLGERLGDFHFYYVILTVAALLYLLARNLSASPIGRAFRALHANESVAASLGVNVPQAKLMAFVVSSFYAGIAGALFAPLIGFIDPLEFGLSAAIHHIVFIVIGGLGSVLGAVFGALCVSTISEVMAKLKEYNELIFNLVLLAVLFVLPRGFAGVAEALLPRLGPSRSGRVSC